MLVVVGNARDFDRRLAEYEALLLKGGSQTPQELMASVGIDIKDPAFWQGGLDVLGGMVAEFEKLYAETKV